MKKKILHIITSLSGGGAQRVLFRLIDNSKKIETEFEHIILNLSQGGFYEKKFLEINVKVYNIGIPKGTFSIKYIFDIINYLKNINFDIIQTWMYHSDFLGGILSKLFTNKNVIWNIRSANLSWKLNKWHTIVIARICSMISYFIPDKIISNSNKAIAYHRSYGYSKKKFNLIFNGFDSQYLKPNSEIRKNLRKKFNINEDDFVIGNIARWDLQKDQNNLLNAFSKLGENKKIKLFLLGENINYNNLHLTNLIEKYKIDKDNIILQEQTDSVYDFINIFDLSVISSIGESFPNAIPESMLMCIPVVSTKVGDIESVIDASTGWICESGNSTDLFEKISFAIFVCQKKKDEWEKKKINCRKKIINFFGIKEMLDNYNNVWKETLNEKTYSSKKKFLNYKYNYNKPTVCHIISSMSHGGAQQVLARIIRADNSVNHEIISLLNLGRYGNELVNEGYNILSLNMNKFSLNIRKIYSLYKIIKEKKYILIQTWMYHADLIGGIIGYLLDKKVYWNIRNSDLNPLWSSYTTIVIQKFCSILSRKIPNKIISCSHRAKEIHSKIGYDNNKFKVIDNGYDLNEIKFDSILRKNFREKFEIKDNEFIFGMVARWDPQKDFSNLIQSIELFFDHNQDAKVKIFLAGPHIENNNIDLTKLIKKKIKKNIFLLGNIKNVIHFMNGIDCHLLSSAGNEGFPNVIGEAMACELPCISTDVGDISKLIYDKNWIVPTKSPDVFAQKMKEIYQLAYNNIGIFNKIKKNNREHIMNNFEIKKMIQSYHSSWINC